MANQFKCFIFDLDGTLIDSVDDLTTAFNYMRSKFNYPPVDRAKMETLIGNGMRDVIAQLEEAGLRERGKVMVGGGPVTEAFARRIGADIYTANAAEAARAVLTLARKTTTDKTG